MTGRQRRDMPVTGCVLRPVADGITGSGSEPSGAVAVPPLVPVTRTERTVAAGRRWAGRLWLDPGRPAHRAWHHAPRTMSQHRAWIQGRTWMPPDAEGRSETVIIVAVIAYDHLIARPLKTIGKTIDAAPDHPKRLLSLVAFIAVVVLIFLH